MASSEILKNLINVTASGSLPSTVMTTVMTSTGVEEREVKTVKVTTDSGDVVVYDLFHHYEYSNLTASLTYANISGENFATYASGGTVSPVTLYSATATKIGNSGASYGSSSVKNPSGATLTYTLNSGEPGTTINSKSGAVTVANRGTKTDTSSSPVSVGTVTVNVGLGGKSASSTSAKIYRQANTKTVEYGVPTGTVTLTSTSTLSSWGHSNAYTIGGLNSVSVSDTYKYTSGAQTTASGKYALILDGSVGSFGSVITQAINLINEDTGEEDTSFLYPNDYTLYSTWAEISYAADDFWVNMNYLYGYDIDVEFVASIIDDSWTIYDSLAQVEAMGDLPPIDAVWVETEDLKNNQDWKLKVSVVNENDHTKVGPSAEVSIPNVRTVIKTTTNYAPYINLWSEGLTTSSTSSSNGYRLGATINTDEYVQYASGYGPVWETASKQNVDPQLNASTTGLKNVQCGNTSFEITFGGHLSASTMAPTFGTAVLIPSIPSNTLRFGNLRINLYMLDSTPDDLRLSPKSGTITLKYTHTDGTSKSVTKNVEVWTKITGIAINSLTIPAYPSLALPHMNGTPGASFNLSSTVTLTYENNSTLSMTMTSGKWTGVPSCVDIQGKAGAPGNNNTPMITGVAEKCGGVSISSNPQNRSRTQELIMTVTASTAGGGVSANKKITLYQHPNPYEQISYSVINQTSYGFVERNDGTVFNGSNKYYESNNQTVSNSAASAVIKINLLSGQTGFKIYYISDGEEGIDYGVVSTISDAMNFTLGNLTSPNFTGSGLVRVGTSDISVNSFVTNHGTPGNLLYAEYTGLTAGTYYVSAKYIKNGSLNRGVDSLRFTVVPSTVTVTSIGDGKYHGPSAGSSGSTGSGGTGGGETTPTVYYIAPQDWPAFKFVNNETGALISDLTPDSSGYPGYLNDNIYFYEGTISKNGAYISDFGYTSPDAGQFGGQSLYSNNTHVNGDKFTIYVESAVRVINEDLGDNTHIFMEDLKFTDAKGFGVSNRFEKDGVKVSVPTTGGHSTDTIIGSNGNVSIDCHRDTVSFVPTNGVCPDIIMIENKEE